MKLAMAMASKLPPPPSNIGCESFRRWWEERRERRAGVRGMGQKRLEGGGKEGGREGEKDQKCWSELVGGRRGVEMHRDIGLEDVCCCRSKSCAAVWMVLILEYHLPAPDPP